MHNHNQPLKDRILADIHAGRLSMRPRLYFMLKVAALALVALMILTISVFIVNFIVFNIRINSDDALLFFGPRGWKAFFVHFPWLLLAVGIGLIAALEWLLRRFRFGYSTPALYLLGGLFIVIVCAGVLVDRATPLNDRLFERGREGLPPPLGALYGDARRALPPGSGTCHCTILSIDGNTLTVESLRDGTTTLTVVLPEDDTRATTSGLMVGDRVFIIGDEQDGVIEAYGVRREPPMRFLGPGRAPPGP